MASLSSSYELIGRILTKLVLGGLSTQRLSASNVFQNTLAVEDRSHFWDVMSWLIAEGFIKSQHQSMNGEFGGVQLTSKGIAAVEAKSFAASDNGSVREVIEAQQDGNLSSDTYGKIGSFIGGFAGGFVQALS